MPLVMIGGDVNGAIIMTINVDQVDNRTGEKLIFRRSGMALPPVLGQDTDSDAGKTSLKYSSL